MPAAMQTEWDIRGQVVLADRVVIDGPHFTEDGVQPFAVLVLRVELCPVRTLKVMTRLTHHKPPQPPHP